MPELQFLKAMDMERLEAFNECGFAFCLEESAVADEELLEVPGLAFARWLCRGEEGPDECRPES